MASRSSLPGFSSHVGISEASVAASATGSAIDPSRNRPSVVNQKVELAVRVGRQKVRKAVAVQVSHGAAESERSRRGREWPVPARARISNRAG